MKKVFILLFAIIILLTSCSCFSGIDWDKDPAPYREMWQQEFGHHQDDENIAFISLDEGIVYFYDHELKLTELASKISFFDPDDYDIRAVIIKKDYVYFSISNEEDPRVRFQMWKCDHYGNNLQLVFVKEYSNNITQRAIGDYVYIEIWHSNSNRRIDRYNVITNVYETVETGDVFLPYSDLFADYTC